MDMDGMAGPLFMLLGVAGYFGIGVLCLFIYATFLRITKVKVDHHPDWDDDIFFIVGLWWLAIPVGICWGLYVLVDTMFDRVTRRGESIARPEKSRNQEDGL